MAKINQAKYPASKRLSLLSKADPGLVEAAFRTCQGRLPSEWIARSSHFRTDSQGELKRNIQSALSNPRGNFSAAAEYAAAGSILHCTDGWSYFGRAISALSAGSTAQSIHFAYYAELHAAIAILACNGVVVTNHTSAALTANNGVVQVHDTGTHRAVWDLLRDWSGLPGAANIVGEIVESDGVKLNDWLFRKQFGNRLTATLQALVSSWGMDLEHYSKDRDRRNSASYEPTGLSLTPRAGYVEWAVNAVDASWSLIEPTAQGTFPYLDRFLVRLVLEQVHQGVYGQWTAQAGSRSRRRWDEDLERMFSKNASNAMASYLASATRPVDPPIFAAARMSPKVTNDPTDHEVLGVYGRTLILLRLATGMVDRLRVRSGLRAHDLRSWADYIGEDLGFWDPSDAPAALTDLWNPPGRASRDIAELVDDGTVTTMAELGSLAAELWMSSTMTRVAVWSLSA